MAGESLYPVWVDGRGFLVDTSRQAGVQESFRRTSVQLLNTQQNIDKGESALTTPEVWRRTYQSWHHGEGQLFADRENSDPFRFYRSRGVNVWEKWELTLLNDSEQIAESPAGGTSDAVVLGTGLDNVLVVLSADRRTVSRVHIPPVAGQLAVTAPPQWSSPSRIVGIGTEYVLAVSDTLIVRKYTKDVSGNLTATSLPVLQPELDTSNPPKPVVPFPTNPAVDYVGFHNGHLLMCLSDGSVWDISSVLSGGNTAKLVTTVPGGVRFVDGTNGLSSIYLLGNIGGKGFVYSIGVDTSTTGVDLTFKGVSAELPTGETGYAIYSYLGYVAVGTSGGFRVAAQQASGVALTYGPLIETPGPVRGFEGQGRFLYYTLSSALDYTEPVPGGGHRRVEASGIGRADLSEFVTDLQPAYATDLMTPLSLDLLADVAWVRMVNGRMIFGLSNGPVYAETVGHRVPDGYVELSAYTFNVTDNKIGLYTLVRTRPGSQGGGGLFAQYNQDKVWHELASDVSLPPQTPTDLVKFDLGNSKFGSVQFAGVIQRGGREWSTPAVVGVETRATYERGMASEWQVPCLLSDEIERDNGTTETRNVVDDFLHLIRLVQQGTTFTYREGTRQWTVYATDFVWSPQERSVYNGWQGVFTIYFREIK